MNGSRDDGTILLVGASLYVGSITLFAWQTWEFVNWLFPQDQWFIKILTLLTFDAMCVFWAAVLKWYHFHSFAAYRIAWASEIAAFFCSLAASVIYMTLNYAFRVNLAPSIESIMAGAIVSIFSLIINILGLMGWLSLELSKRFPKINPFEESIDGNGASIKSIDGNGASIKNIDAERKRGRPLGTVSRPQEAEAGVAPPTNSTH